MMPQSAGESVHRNTGCEEIQEYLVLGNIKTCECVSTCRPRSPVAAGLELESAAPPMDLERPTQFEGLQVHPLGPPTRSSAGTPLPSPITQLSRPNPTMDALEAELANPVATSGAAAEPDTSVKHVINGENPSIPERGVETASAMTLETVAEGREGESTQPNVVVSSQSGSTVVSSQSGSTGPDIISKEQLETFAEGDCLMCAAFNRNPHARVGIPVPSLFHPKTTASHVQDGTQLCSFNAFQWQSKIILNFM